MSSIKIPRRSSKPTSNSVVGNFKTMRNNQKTENFSQQRRSKHSQSEKNVAPNGVFIKNTTLTLTQENSIKRMAFRQNDTVTKKKKVETNTENRRLMEKTVKPYIVTGLKMGVLSSNVLRDLSVSPVTSSNEDGPGGINDPKGGTLKDLEICRSCGEINFYCPGHVRHIPLPVGVSFIPNIYLDTVLKILKCVCKHCSGLLVTETYMAGSSKGSILDYKGAERLKKLSDECVSSKIVCQRASNTMIGEFAPLKNTKPDLTSKCIANKLYKIHNGSIQSTDPDSKKKGQGAHKGMYDADERIFELTIPEIRKVLKFVSSHDKVLMGFPANFNLEDFISDCIPCSPPCSRPQSYHDGETRIDQLSFGLSEIVKRIKTYNETDGDEHQKKELAKMITYFIYSHLVDNDDEAYKRCHDVIIGIKGLITGKKGVVRGSSMGKRVGYCARTVLGPNSNLRFGEVGVPNATKKVLTIPEVVTKFNIERLQTLYDDNKIVSIVMGKRMGGIYEGNSIKITEKNKEKIGKIDIGDTVKRYSEDGDPCLFGRQPTLHKEGLQSYRQSGDDRLALAPHMCSTSPHNADFDGDEGTQHVLQSNGARTEGKFLANAETCIGNQQTSSTMVGLEYNALSSANIMTQVGEDEIFLTEEEFFEYEQIQTFRDDLPTLKHRLEINNVNPLSGKALFSRILPKDMYYNGEKTEKTYTNPVTGESVTYDVTVRIRDGVLVNGVITKAHVGSKHNSIIQYLWKNYGKVRTASFLTDAVYLTDWFIYNYGFTIGYADCIAPNPDRLKKTIDEEMHNAKVSIDSLGPERPGISISEINYREKQIRDFTNNAATIGKRIGNEDLAPSNPLNIMSGGGAKGNATNTSQIVALVGQSFIRGNRPGQTLNNNTRSSPYFPPNSRKLEARGMITNSFMEGMDPAGTFFHASSARVGLVAISVSTADTGSLHHRISKVLESTVVETDGSIRNSTGGIFKLACFDGMEAGLMIKTGVGEKQIFSFIDLPETVNAMNHNLKTKLAAI